MRSFAVVVALILLAGTPVKATAASWAVDFSRTNGLLRPLHGVNGGPLCYRGVVDLTTAHRELAFPLTRLHDTVWVNADAVDIHAVFPDFRDDPQDPASYDFQATDDYLAAVRASGASVVYRLGESIEHTTRKYRVHPPSDPAKWAEICAGIIRHYNAGWAEGFHHDIRYWEIWNEPDIGPAMWTGTEQEFFTLFEVTARRIKREFPALKIGGPAVGGTGDFRGDRLEPTPFLARFLRHCRDRGVPLDFFSWHRYTADPHDLARRASAIRDLLDAHGFHATESHLNEWNYLPREDWGPMLRAGQGPAREAWFRDIGGPAGAAFSASVLMLLQDRPVDAANYFTGEVQGFGLFDFHGTPKTTYHAFRAFRDLLDCPARVTVEAIGATTAVALAGRSSDARSAAVLAATLQPEGEILTWRCDALPWSGPARWEATILDRNDSAGRTASGTLDRECPNIRIPVEGPATLLIRLKPRETGQP